MTPSALQQLLATALERTIPRPTPRDGTLPCLPGKADALIGMRRVGKTWRLFQHLHERLASGVPRERLLYLNLEDDRFVLEVADLSVLYDAWLARVPGLREAEHWLYLDEIQNVPGWETFVRRLTEDRRTGVLVTGSSAKLLSAEVATSLRGRALPTEVLPFSLAEAMRHAGEAIPSTWPLGQQARADVQRSWARYLETGGFPEVQGLDAPLRRRVLQNYVDVAILRDVIERHGVTQVGALRWLVRRLLAHPAGRFTLNKLHHALKSQGLGVGKATVADLLGHLEDAHLVHTLQLWSPNQARRRTHPSKAYPVDPALSRTAAFAKPEDLGHRLETLVYLELRRRGWAEIGYLDTPEGFEVDFVGRDGAGALGLVQVCVDLSDPDTRHRELRALRAGMAATGCAEATLVVAGLPGDPLEEEVDGGIRTVAAWRWLLAG